MLPFFIYLFVYLTKKWNNCLSNKKKIYNRSIRTRSEKLWILECFEGCEFKGTSLLTIPRCAFLSVCGALLDCVYFAEGHFTSGCLEMNGELISPTATSQSLHIYSPAVTSPRPGKQWHPCLLQMSRTKSEAIKTGHVNAATKAQKNKIK